MFVIRWAEQVADFLNCIGISRPAVNSALVSLAVEIPVCIFLSLLGMKEFAFYISNSERVADITKKMWQVSVAQDYSPLLFENPSTDRTRDRTSTGATSSTHSTISYPLSF